MIFSAGNSLLVKDGWNGGCAHSEQQAAPEKSQVITHSDAIYCVVMSCVGGEVTVLMEPLWR
ncbi:MAG: hypothetical protein K0Q55_4007 [Verrucomicrobia bacterium]|jgi:hypothetical protein|nr:hypothetical protein [Verrucomicrobiota bacterium]